ncbi:MAG: DUF4189 domain-containing protein [Alphaproteobacteria bacterium]|nr:MAG: DUF4189 domain-containing protein [Alphaproteobacteria bacterium]
MRGTLLIAGGIATVILLLVNGAPAHAEYGAIAYDQMTGSYASSSNEPTAARAKELALKNCGSPGCQVHAVEPHGCGALAKSDTDKAWGGADRETLDAAKREAVEHCQTHTSTGHCNVVVSACNR